MERGICVMVMVSATKKGEKVPTALAITIAPTPKIAVNLAKDELGPFVSTETHEMATQQIGQIITLPIPSTVFLYTEIAGRIK